MIPIVETYVPEKTESSDKLPDRRKHKRLFWKEALKLSEYSRVLNALKPCLEPNTTEDAQAPVRACHRYIKNSPEQLDYKTAIEQELPIGSAEIESAHRYVVQKRLKLAGAWWNIEHAKNMINLRTCRANDLWHDYWKKAA